MGIYSSRNWTATESTDLAGGNRKLTVKGEVEVGGGNEEPFLTEPKPQGINPTILILELGSVAGGGGGIAALVWKDVSFVKLIEEDQYSKVDVQGQATFAVEKIIS